MNKTLISLGFDTEDIFMPDEYDFDGIINTVSDILLANKLTGSFCLTGDKIRRIVSKKRFDVINSLKKHIVESHTDSGSRHPNVLEYLENKTWDEGVREVLTREQPCFDLIKNIFGTDSMIMNAHNNTHGAQLVYAMSLMKKGIRLGSSRYHNYLGENKSAGWFCNTVFIAGGGVCKPGLFRKAWDQDFCELQKRFNLFKNSGKAIITGNVFHAMEMKSKIMSDRFWAANGINFPIDDYEKRIDIPLRTEQETTTFISNFNKYCDFISRQTWLENVGLGEIIHRYSCQPVYIRNSDIEEAVSCSLESFFPYIGGFFSPAEILIAASEAIVQHKKTGVLPLKIKRRNILGPLQAPNMFPQALEVNDKIACTMAKYLLNFSNRYNSLPHNIEVDGVVFGIGSVYHTICEHWLNLYRSRKNNKITLVSPGLSVDEKFMHWLPEAGMTSEIGMDNILTKPGLNTHHAALYTRLQTWTLKPAYLKDDLKRAGFEIEKPFIGS
jgi:hypothetical protein